MLEAPWLETHNGKEDSKIVYGKYYMGKKQGKEMEGPVGSTLH